MNFMDERNIEKIESILVKQQENIFNITTENYLQVSPDEIVEAVQDGYPKIARGKDEIMYLYVVDRDGKLLGVIDLKELPQADDNAMFKAIMTKNIIALKKESTLGEVSNTFSRYDFRVLPVVDKADNMIGVVRYRDVTKLTHHFLE
jgi:magnesium transporter